MGKDAGIGDQGLRNFSESKQGEDGSKNARKMEREIYEIFSRKICETCKAYASTGVLSVVLYSQSYILRGLRLKALLRTMCNPSIA